jgi:hypothetical protein
MSDSTGPAAGRAAQLRGLAMLTAAVLLALTGGAGLHSGLHRRVRRGV